MSLPKLAITVTRVVVTKTANNKPLETITTIFEGTRRVVSAEGTGIATIYSQQGMNTQGSYLVYFEKQDSNLEIQEGDQITFDLNGTKTIFVKKLRPMTLVIQNKALEVFCLSTAN